MKEYISEPKGIIAWFAQNSVAANLLMFALFSVGLMVISQTKTEVFPPIDPRTISISVEYPGATPEEIEDSITRRIEDAVMGLEGVERVNSSAAESFGSVTLELNDFINAQSVKEEAQSAVDQLLDFPPEDANEANVSIAKPISAVMRLVVSGAVSEKQLKQSAESLRRHLLTEEDVSMITLQGARDYEIAIEISQNQLQEYDLRIEQVAAAIRASSVNLSLGTVRTSGGDILLRTSNEARDAEAFNEIIILSDADGRLLTLGDIATIDDGFIESELINSYQGNPAVFLQVNRAEDEDAFAVKQAIEEGLSTFLMPDGIQAVSVADTTIVVNDRINLLLRNAVIGLALVFVFLALTLDLRLAFWTSVGIPAAFIGGFIIIGQFTSINMTSLFGLIIVLGIVVDDAVVVGENIHEHQERNGAGVLSAIAGAKSMFVPVLIGVVTSMIAFASLLQSSGIIGQMLQPVAIVVLCVLFVSLIEAFLILPNHLAHGSDWSKGAMLTLRNRVRDGLNSLRDSVFVPMAKLSVRFPYFIIAFALSLMLITSGLISGGHIRFIFFPSVEGDEITVALEMPAGTAFSDTQNAMQQVIDGLDVAFGDEADELYQSISVTVGGKLTSGFGSSGTELGSEIATATLELRSADSRSISSAEIERLWLGAVGPIPGVKSLVVESAGISSGADLSFNLSHPNEERLLQASAQLVSALENINGVREIESTAQLGKRQINFSLTPAGTAAGLSVDDLSRSIRRAYFGEEVTRIQRDGEEIKVLVRFPKNERDNLADLASLKIPLANGTEVALSTVASIQETRSFVSINRVDGQRIISVSADVDEAVTTPNIVNSMIQNEIIEEIKTDFVGLRVSTEGHARSQSEELNTLIKNFLTAILIIYVLIASVLRSYIQPLVIMAIIPFGLVGAVFGHLLLGYDLSFLSFFGVVALSGVIINDSIVLIDYYNEKQKLGGDTIDSIIEAVRRRFRPILITTLTTFIGLLPMIAETSMQAQFLIPMALSIAFGILVSSFFILLLVPACLALRASK